VWESDEAGGTRLTTPLAWHQVAQPLIPPRTDPPRDKDVNDRRDNRREMQTGTRKTKVGLVALISSH